MPRRVQDGEASAAGAANSVATAGAGLECAQDLDRAYFRTHPQARSYTRPYIEGECLLLTEQDARPAFVAVAFVSAGVRVKVAAFSRAELLEAKREAEALAGQQRGGAPRGVSA